MDVYAEIEQRAGLILDNLARRALERVDLSAPDAFDRVVEAVAVPETWFFRDGEPFVCLARFAASAPRPLRLLSAPCSTGEEPYSMAIALLESGLAPAEFEIDAVDISAKALDVARDAVYSKVSFRQHRPDLAGRYFESVEGGFKLLPEIARLVRFRRGNLLETADLAGPYHVIFCRNLLIYMHAAARTRLMASMRARLADGGVLFAGHSELTVFLQAGFRKLEHARAFACSKAPSAPPPKVAQARAPLPAVRRERQRQDGTPPAAQPTLEDARQLADGGKFAAAAAICQRLAPGAEVFCLQGLIHQTANRLAEAEECFCKALYLDPQHQDALMYMSLLCEARGARERSAVFRDRARRAAVSRRSEGKGEGGGEGI